MRTTLTIDDEAYAMLKSIADFDNISISAAISRLVKEAVASNRRIRTKGSLPTYTGRPKDFVMTPEMIKAIGDEI